MRSTAELLQIVDQQAIVAKSKGTQGSTVIADAPAADMEMTVLGDGSAPVRIAWFIDIRGALAQLQATLLRSLVDAYPGKLRVVYKALELPNHPDSEFACLGVLAAAEKNSFWPMFEAIV